jgi:hypothetical protein
MKLLFIEIFAAMVTSSHPELILGHFGRLWQQNLR